MSIFFIFASCFFDEPIIFEESDGVLQLRRLFVGASELSHHPMTPSVTAFDVDKPKLGLLSKRQIGTGVPPAAPPPPEVRGPTGAEGKGHVFHFIFLFVHTVLSVQLLLWKHRAA